jgi:hypothetical protein
MLFIAFLLILGVAAAGVALYKSDILPNDDDGNGSILAGIFGGKDKDVVYSGDFTADLAFNGLSLREISKISARTSGQNSLSVNSEKLEFSDATLEAKEFSGDLSIADDLSLSGKSAVVSVNGVRVTPQLGSLNVDGTLSYDSITLELSLENFSYESSGTLIVGEEAIDIEDSTLVLAGFAGTFTVDGNRLRISGTAGSIQIK